MNRWNVPVAKYAVHQTLLLGLAPNFSSLKFWLEIYIPALNTTNNCLNIWVRRYQAHQYGSLWKLDSISSGVLVNPPDRAGNELSFLMRVLQRRAIDQLPYTRGVRVRC